MYETVSIKIRIDDSGTFKNVTVDAEDLNKAIKYVTKQWLKHERAKSICVVER